MKKRTRITDEKWMKELKEIQKYFVRNANRDLKNNKDNGKRGIWEVIGIRHMALVKAKSATEAVEKAKDIVGDWELMTVRYIGKEMPEVYPTK